MHGAEAEMTGINGSSMVEDEDFIKLLGLIDNCPKSCIIYKRRKGTIKSINIINHFNIQEDFQRVGYIAIIRKTPEGDTWFRTSQCFLASATKKSILTTYHSVASDVSFIYAFFHSKHYILIYKIPPSPIISNREIDYALFKLPKYSLIPWKTGFVDKIVGKPEMDKLVHIITNRTIEKTAHSIEANVIETPIDMKNYVNESEFLIDKSGIKGDSGAPVLDKDWGLRGMYRGGIHGGQRHFGLCANIIYIVQDIKIKQPFSEKNFKNFQKAFLALSNCTKFRKKI
ncbi:hypothetical protein COCON_G00224640 [Conger conger]|uniref:Serine protease n=1 Tax=Conger conger TaxID=82655 RepID=A0A9Q1CX44_CONCO|nr:hypothetical protein COCON_G00224640 [Conger conger]